MESRESSPARNFQISRKPDRQDPRAFASARGMYFYWGAGEQPQRRVVRGSRLHLAASGERHSLLLLTDGTVWSCGDNGRGQLGRKGVKHAKQPGEPPGLGVGGEGAMGGAEECWDRRCAGALRRLARMLRASCENEVFTFVSARALYLFRFPFPLPSNPENVFFFFGFRFLFKTTLRRETDWDLAPPGRQDELEEASSSGPPVTDYLSSHLSERT